MSLASCATCCHPRRYAYAPHLLSSFTINPPTHTHAQKQVVDTTCRHGQVIPMLLQPHILSLPKKSRTQTLCFLLDGTHAFAVSHRNYKTDFFSFQMKKKITPK